MVEGVEEGDAVEGAAEGVMAEAEGLFVTLLAADDGLSRRYESHWRGWCSSWCTGAAPLHKPACCSRNRLPKANSSPSPYWNVVCTARGRGIGDVHAPADMTTTYMLDDQLMTSKQSDVHLDSNPLTRHGYYRDVARRAS